MSGTYTPGKSFHPAGTGVEFFLRLHRHLPDRHCGLNPFAPCEYREDREPINIRNERVDELKKDPAFVAKEQEVEAAVKSKWEAEGWL